MYEWKLKTFKRSRENVLKVHYRLHMCMCSEQVLLAVEDIMPAFNIRSLCYLSCVHSASSGVTQVHLCNTNIPV